MTSCDRMSDRMPDVAGARARWSRDEERHLAGCEACRIEWDVVRAAAGIGTGAGTAPRLDEAAIADAVLRRLRTEPATASAAPVVAAVPDVPGAGGTAVPLSSTDPGQRRAWSTRLVRFRRAWLSGAAAASLLLAIGALAWWAGAWPWPRPPAAEPRYQTELVARPGQRATFPLPDGSWVVLRANSRLRYAPPLSTSPYRDVYLDGEAYFEVAHDLARPFRVHTGAAVTRVLGTRFGVRAYPREDTVRVVVAEGQVSLWSGAAAETVLGPGELGTLVLGDTVVVRHGVNVASYLAWASEAVFADARNGAVVLGVWSQDTLTQEQRMKLGSRSIPGLALPALIAGAALAHPTPARAQAQAVKPADLVGTWVETQWRITRHDYTRAESPYVHEAIWTFRADSTWAVRVRTNGVEDTVPMRRSFVGSGRWELRGDTLRASDNAKKLPVRSGRVARTGGQLVWARAVDTGECMDTLQRVDGSKPLPPPATTPPPSTVSPAALAGTWVKSWEKSFRGPAGSDTLTLGADKTARARAWARSGEWELFPDDYLGITSTPDFFALKVATTQGQVVIAPPGCFNTELVYKRVSP